MRGAPKCSVRLSENLLELRRKEDLEKLRAPLRDHGIFTSDKDPNTAPITNEELKKLVRFWKLHERRSFWKDHPNKDDLVEALLRFSTSKQGRRNSSGPQPTPPQRLKPSGRNPLLSGRRRFEPGKASSCDGFEIGLKRYDGDLFYQQDSTAGMVYLSRHQPTNNEKNDKNKEPDVPRRMHPSHRGSKASMGSHVGGRASRKALSVSSRDLGPGPHPGSEARPDDVQSQAGFEPQDNAHAEQTREHNRRARKVTVAEQLYRFSLDPTVEDRIVQEGALEALMEMSTSASPDPLVAGYSAAALCNLCGSPVTRARLIQAGFTERVCRLLTGAQGEQQECWCLLLAYLSLEAGSEERMLSTVLPALLEVEADKSDRKKRRGGGSGGSEGSEGIDLSTSSGVSHGLMHKAILVTLANLSVAPGGGREVLVDLCLTTCAPLVAAARAEGFLVLVRTLENLSLHDRALSILTEHGVLGIFNGLVADQVTASFAPFEVSTLCSTIARTLENMAARHDVRKAMVTDGVLALATQLLALDASSAVTVLSLCGTLMLLTEQDAPEREAVVSHGGVDAMVRLAKLCDQAGLFKVSYGLCKLTRLQPEETLDRHVLLVKKQAHTVLLTALRELPFDELEPSLCGLCNLLVQPTTHAELVQSGVVDIVADVLGSEALDFERQQALAKMEALQGRLSARRSLTAHRQRQSVGRASGQAHAEPAEERQKTPAQLRAEAHAEEQARVRLQQQRQKITQLRIIICKMLANLTSTLSVHSAEVNSRLLRVLTGLAAEKPRVMMLTCASAFANFSAASSSRELLQEMLDLSVPRALLTILDREKTAQKAALRQAKLLAKRLLAEADDDIAAAEEQAAAAAAAHNAQLGARPQATSHGNAEAAPEPRAGSTPASPIHSSPASPVPTMPTSPSRANPSSPARAFPTSPLVASPPMSPPESPAASPRAHEAPQSPARSTRHSRRSSISESEDAETVGLTASEVEAAAEESRAGGAVTVPHCAAVLDNLSSFAGFHLELHEQGCVPILRHLADGCSLSQRRCASALRNLSTAQTPDLGGLLDTIQLLLCNTSDSEVVRVCADALYRLSCCQQSCAPVLATHIPILKLLFGTLRAGLVATQQHSARALCNITRVATCAATLLTEDSDFDVGLAGKMKATERWCVVNDFIVIAVLRANDEAVRRACAETLFNLLSFDQYRGRMVKQNILWSTLRLEAGIPEEQITGTTIGMQVLLNMSCDPESKKILFDQRFVGPANLLSMAGRSNHPNARRAAMDLLLNVLVEPAHAEPLVHEGVVRVLHQLTAGCDDDPACVPDVARMVYCCAQCPPAILVHLVRDGATDLLAPAMASESSLVAEMACVAVYNLTCPEPNRADLLDEVGPALVSVLLSAARLSAPTRTDKDKNETSDRTTLLALAALCNLSSAQAHQQRLAREKLAIVCASFASSSDVTVQRFCVRLLANLATDPDIHAQLMADGCLGALQQLLSRSEHDHSAEVLGVTMALASSLRVCSELVEARVLALLASVLAGPHAVGEWHRRTVASIFRNLTCDLECRPLLTGDSTQLVELLHRLVEGANGDEAVLKSTAVGLFNLIVDGNNHTTRVLQEAFPLLTTMFHQTRDEETKTACGFSLVACRSALAGPAHPANADGAAAGADEATAPDGQPRQFNDGAVIALLAAMSSEEDEDKNKIERGPVAAPPDSLVPRVDMAWITARFPPSVGGCDAHLLAAASPVVLDTRAVPDWTLFGHLESEGGSDEFSTWAVASPEQHASEPPPRPRLEHKASRFCKLDLIPLKVQVRRTRTAKRLAPRFALDLDGAGEPANEADELSAPVETMKFALSMALKHAVPQNAAQPRSFDEITSAVLSSVPVEMKGTAVSAAAEAATEPTAAGGAEARSDAADGVGVDTNSNGRAE